MHLELLPFLYPSLLLLSVFSPVSAAKAKVKPKNAILLSDVQSLTLRGDAKTAHRRVSAIPQLKCISTKAICDLHTIDVMRCTNQGAGYNSEDIQWSCTASLPEELKLGSTDVICEGYASPEDPFVLKGSCGVEYRMALTDKGEQRYPNLGKGAGWFGEGDGGSDWGAYIFTVIFLAVLGWIVYSACVAQDNNRRLGGGAPRRRGWGGGGGGGGGWGPGWGPGNDHDPPPPYPGTKPSTQQGWQPGFWSGLAGGAAAGYMAGNRGNNSRQDDRSRGFGSNYGSGSQTSWGAGPSRTPSGSSSSSARHESTGFGSTTRR